MLKLVAAILVLAGCSGVGISVCIEERKRIAMLKKMQHTMLMIQNEVSYAKSTLPEICIRMEKLAKEPYHLFFQKLNEEIQKNNGETFPDLWKKCKEGMQEIQYLKKEDKERFLAFLPDSDYYDSGMQEREMEDKLAELQKIIAKSEKSIETNTKVYMCVGMMSGILCNLLFW